MGTAAGSFDEETESEDIVSFWEAWNEATRDEKHRMGIMIGKEVRRLLKSEGRSAKDARKELARFVRKRIIKKKS
jgi:hypothetical protein